LGELSGVNDADRGITQLGEGDIAGGAFSLAMAWPGAKAFKLGKEGIEEGVEQVTREGAQEAGEAAARRAARNAAVSPRLWSPRETLGRRVYQRDDLIDLTRKSDRGESSLSLMRRGNAPIGEDGVPIELHHATQREPGSVVEVTKTLHQTRYRELHINPSNQLPSGIDRREFSRFKREYWQRRAESLSQGD
jgi:hypothetical protein